MPGLLLSASSANTPAPAGIRWLGVGVVALVTELALVHVVGRFGRGDLVFLLLPVAHLMLVPFLWKNRSFWGCRLITLGFALNLVAMVGNGGLMPVSSATVQSVGRTQPSELAPGAAIVGTKNYFAGEDRVRFEPLTDNIVVQLPAAGSKAVSVGDLVVLAGALILYLEGTARAGLWRHLLAGRPSTQASPNEA